MRTELLVLLTVLLAGMAVAAPPVQVTGPPATVAGPPAHAGPQIPDVADPAVNVSQIAFYGFSGNRTPPGQFRWQGNRSRARAEARAEIREANRSIARLARFRATMRDLVTALDGRERERLRTMLAEVDRSLQRSRRMLNESHAHYRSGSYEKAWQRAVAVQDRVGTARLRLEQRRAALRSNLSNSLEQRIDSLANRVEQLNETVSRLERRDKVPPVAVRNVRQQLQEARTNLQEARRKQDTVANASNSVEAIRTSSSVVRQLEQSSASVSQAESTLQSARAPWYTSQRGRLVALLLGAVLGVTGFLYYRFRDDWWEDEDDRNTDSRGNEEEDGEADD